MQSFGVFEIVYFQSMSSGVISFINVIGAWFYEKYNICLLFAGYKHIRNISFYVIGVLEWYDEEYLIYAVVFLKYSSN